MCCEVMEVTSLEGSVQCVLGILETIFVCEPDYWGHGVQRIVN